MDHWIEGLPKIDLHCHLDGSLSRETVRFLAKESGAALPREDAELDRLLRADDNCASLAEYLEKFDLPLACLHGRKQFSLAAQALVRDAAAEHVRYLEVRFAPMLSSRDGLTPRDTIEGVLEGLRLGAQETGITAAAILCGMRHFPIEPNLEVVRLAKEYLNAGVCAVDIAGDEKAFPLANHTQMFRLARALGVPYTIHAGECGDPQEVSAALDLGAQRIGHGIAMRHNPALLRRCVEKRVGVELCPVSNLQTKAVSGWPEYPFRQFLEAGVMVTVNTDNRTVSKTTITREMTLLQEHCGASHEELRQVCRNAAAVAFAPGEIRQSLLREIDRYI